MRLHPARRGGGAVIVTWEVDGKDDRGTTVSLSGSATVDSMKAADTQKIAEHYRSIYPDCRIVRFDVRLLDPI